MAVKFSNNAATTLSVGIALGATSFTVASVAGFPVIAAGDWTYVSLTDEVVKVTAINTTTKVFTCAATASAHVASVTVELRMTAELLNDFAEDTEADPTGEAVAMAIALG